MDFLECGICHIAYNEDEHKPRNSPCGHEFCSTCLKALINDGEYICPKCREKYKVTAVEELPVAFGLMDVIRAFRANTISLTKEANMKITGATNEDICPIHCKVISHWCYYCQLWICVECLDSHTSLTGCSTTSATKAVGDLKDHNNKSVDQLLTKFEKDTNQIASKIQKHNDKRKELLEKAEKHGEEVKKLQYLLQQGTDHKKKLEESKKDLNDTNSPFAVSDGIKIVTQRKQTLISWSAKNVGTDNLPEPKQELLKALEITNEVYVEKIINNEKIHCKLSRHDKFIYVHTLQPKNIAHTSSCIPFDQLEKMIPSDATLVFLELSIGGVVQGKVHLRLDKNLPNTRKYFIQRVWEEHGLSLTGTTLNRSGNLLYKNNLPLTNITFTPDKNGQCKVKRGDLFGDFENGYLKHLFFSFVTSPQNFSRNYCVFGSIESGREVSQKCFDHHSKGIEITDCGLIIKCD